MSSRIPAKLRKAVMAAANNQCAFCRSQESAMGVTFEIDHIIPLAEGGKSSLANLCLCCPSCNRYKSAPSIPPRTGKPLFFTLCANVGPSTLHGATRARKDCWTDASWPGNGKSFEGESSSNAHSSQILAGNRHSSTPTEK